MTESKIIELSESVHVLGKAEFRVLQGVIFINGKTFKPSSEDNLIKFYSPKSTALLQIEPQSPATQIEFFELSNGSEGLQSCQPNFGNIFEPEMEMIESYEKIISGLYFLKGTMDSNVPIMRITDEWRETLSLINNHQIPSNPVIFICGHRKVGKSAFSRFLLNGLLNECEEIDFVDLDPGQTEFTPPGFVSRKRFNTKEYLLGPPFSHLQIPDDSVYLASSNPNDAPFLYCQAIETIKENMKLLPKVPMIINTMGWMTGLGLEFIQHSLKVFKPSHVLAFMPLEGEDLIRKCLISTSFRSTEAAFNLEESEQVYVRYMSNPTNDSPRAKHSPVDQRNFAYWSYFFGHFPSESNQISLYNFNRQLSQIKPMVVPLSCLQLSNTSREIDLFEILGTRSRCAQMKLLESWLLMRLVGLARDDQFTPKQGNWINLLRNGQVKRISEIPCIGLGLVRSIVRCSTDDRIHLHVITPLPLSKLSTVNTFILGNLQLPISMISSDTLSMKAESPGFSTQIVGTDVAGAGARKTRHNMRRK